MEVAVDLLDLSRATLVKEMLTHCNKSVISWNLKKQRTSIRTHQLHFEGIAKQVYTMFIVSRGNPCSKRISPLAVLSSTALVIGAKIQMQEAFFM